VLIGKAYMYGLAVAGEAGVARVLEIVRVELERTMALSGCATIADIDSSLVRVDRGIPLEGHGRQHAEEPALEVL
jgi:isopentenyl diphosphate isomerase/L-lactate dehydrogenase-like FMN-dependent dehydrogenase